jgi:hypothetical protein
LTTLSKLLGHYYCGFFFNQASSQEAILQLLLRIIRRQASSREAILATKAIGLVFVNQSPDISQGQQEAFYSMTLPFLKSITKDGNNPELKRLVFSIFVFCFVLLLT